MKKDSQIPLYWKAPYQKEILAKITAIKDNEIQLDQSFFYPGGGGQLPDNGTLILNDNEHQIIDTYKVGDEIWHKIDPEVKINFDLFQDVLLRLNWERRYAFMKAHSAQHLISHLFKKLYDSDTSKANFEIDKMEIEILKPLSFEEVLNVMNEANDLILRGDEIKSIIVDKETYQKNYLSKTRGKKSQEDVVRLIQLGEDGFDLVCCGGIHVDNLSEIKGIFLESVKENTIKLLVDRVGLEFTNKQRKLMIELENLTTKKGDKLLETIRNKLIENQSLEEASVILMKFLLKESKSLSKKINNHTILLLSLPEVDRQIIQYSAKELCKNVFVAILAKNDILCLLSSDKSLPADEIVKILMKKLDRKGGGSKAFAQIFVKEVDEPLKLVEDSILSCN
ncbi:MAG: alanyl-tRNA editing protein [Candidatus Heimdallarchaeota archaeon]